ncbi:MAG: DegT/DnrJ/EryC1/StrS family aminotransferase [Planctomycetota bacterium]
MPEPRPEIRPVALPDDQRAEGRSFDEAELALLREVLDSGTLTATKGAMTRRLESDFAERLGRAHAIALSSGSAAVHAAVAALEAEPGEEVVTTPITDMGALACMLAQGLIPVFADVDPRTGNVDASTVAARLSDRTRAVVATHLFGRLADPAPLVSLCRTHDLRLVEDAAQAFDARHGAVVAGAYGDIACFSFQQGKHMTTGEGGIAVTDDPGLARALRLFVNKSWPYGETDPDHEGVAPNYRMNELTAAVAVAQLGKLDGMLASRRRAVARFRAGIEDLAGIELPAPAREADPAWWRLGLIVDPEFVPGGNVALGAALRRRGVGAAPRYVGKPAFACRVFRERRTFGSSEWPFPLARPEALDWSPERFPGVRAFLDRVLVLAINERYDDDAVDRLLDALRDARDELGGHA